ncbi:PAS domain-containing protein [Bizionia saleffrena]|uniref:histidine kinase n=1 Tax=Bizionia saleffrena TaxID=291189 RepID=A0A8H2QKX9_9FLAO|nr:PAS domain-containing sensor histidine kinase [Bizionia saleffrena]TYB72618.1 PAS domain-containing protein [Bizionia saleffrena]
MHQKTNHKTNHFDAIKWEIALSISKIGMWVYNAKTNSFFFSDSSKDILGCLDDPHFGEDINDWNDLIHPDDRYKYHKDFNDHIQGLKPYYVSKHRIKCKNGAYKWILDKGQVVERDADGNYVRFIGTHIDITDQVETEIKINDALNIATEQNTKLKNFAHIVTHNLKEHAANFESLLGFYDEAEDDTEKNEVINHLNQVAGSLNNTITNLKQIVSVQSKKETNTECLNLNDFIEESLKLLDVIIIKNKAKIYNRVSKNVHIYYNSAYLESIIQNLLSNAIKYKHPDRDPIIRIQSFTKKDCIIIKVSDNGLGIDLDKFGNDVFKLYKTFHTNKNSEGVGLYLIKNQVEAFGGTIEIGSKVNVGTVFTIIIPSKKNPT